MAVKGFIKFVPDRRRRRRELTSNRYQKLMEKKKRKGGVLDKLTYQNANY